MASTSKTLVALAALAGAATLPALTATAAQASPSAITTTSSVSFVLSQTAHQTTGLHALSATAKPSRARFRALEPASSHRAAVASWAAAHGLTVTHTGPFVVEVSGPASALAGLVGTTVTKTHVGKAAYVVPQTALSVPAVLRSDVSAVVGLDNRPKFKHADTSYQGPDIQAMNDLTTAASKYDATAGAGATVGILNLSGWYTGNLDAYASTAGLNKPSVTPITVGTGNPTADPATDDGGSGEVALDIESVFATAPQASQRLYFGGNTSADYLAILDAMVSDASVGKLQTASSSWGACEAFTDPNELKQDSLAIQRMTAAGATFFASSGDAAGYDCSFNDGNPDDVDNTPAVDFPASAPYTVAVGGTSVTSTAGAYTYASWGNVTAAPASSSDYAGDGSGGGVSDVFGKPAWQSADAGVTQREVPDIAALADPATGFEDYDGPHSTLDVVGGTSLASPVSAASLAVIEARKGTLGLGNILPTLYANPSAFNDVVTGSNGPYSAGTGYDRVTGLGSPNWTALQGVIGKAQPRLGIVTATRSLTPGVTINDPNAATGSTYAVQYGAGSTCPTSMSATKPTTVTLMASQGAQPVTLFVKDADATCHVVQTSVRYDTVAPVVHQAVTYHGTTAPVYIASRSSTESNSGVAHYTLTLRNLQTKASLTKTSTDSANVIVVSPGFTYSLTTSAVDVAGNTSKAVTTTFRAPNDDRSMTFGKGWVKQTNKLDYAGTQSASGSAGATASYIWAGKSMTLRFAQTPSSGYVNIYIDGKLVRRPDLYLNRNNFNFPINITAPTTGKHTVKLVVAGVHRAGALGSNVILDSFSWS